MSLCCFFGPGGGVRVGVAAISPFCQMLHLYHVRENISETQIHKTEKCCKRLCVVIVMVVVGCHTAVFAPVGKHQQSCSSSLKNEVDFT